MKVGVVFPQTEIGNRVENVRTYAEGVAELGFDHILIYDHVTSVDTSVHPDHAEAARRNGATSKRPYDLSDPFHEAMVLLGFLAGITDLALATGVLILPQRSTALVAKQATEVDILTGGRFRLGIGIGWNGLEFRSMGASFEDRAVRIEEQVNLLRAYWSQPSLSWDTEYHWAVGMGITPRPVQQPIPIWLAAGRRRALERVGRIADGWMPVSVDPGSLANSLTVIREAAVRAGRDPQAIGIEGRIPLASTSGEHDVRELARTWHSLGASHLAIDTMRCGFRSAEEHVEALKSALKATEPRLRR